MAKKTEAMSQFWCFTLNNYTEEDIFILESFGKQIGENPKAAAQYIIIGREVGKPSKREICECGAWFTDPDKTPQTDFRWAIATCKCPDGTPSSESIKPGTPHLQGYIEFKTRKRLTSVKKFMGPRPHLEIRRGTAEEAANYCKKDGKWQEFGTISVPNQGKRTDLDEVRQMASEFGMRAVSATCSLQQIKTAEKFLQYNEEARDSKPEVFWTYGDSGFGKSRLAINKLALDPDDVYTKSEGGKWFDGYDGQSTVILDDFRSWWMTFSDLITLIDRYQRRVEVKGSSREMRAKRIVITCPKHPMEEFKDCGENLKQIMRRIDKIFKISPEGVELMPNWAHQEGIVPNYEAQCADIDRILGINPTSQNFVGSKNENVNTTQGTKICGLRSRSDPNLCACVVKDSRIDLSCNKFCARSSEVIPEGITASKTTILNVQNVHEVGGVILDPPSIINMKRKNIVDNNLISTRETEIKKDQNNFEREIMEFLDNI